MPETEQSPQAERREREMQRRNERKTAPPLAGVFSTQVVGVTHADGYPGVLWDLQAKMERPRRADWEEMTSHYPMFNGEMAQYYAEADYDRLLEEGPYETQFLELIREPDNEHDPNAIGVWWDGHKIGHLNKVIAFRMAPEIDAGTKWLCRVEEVAGEGDLIGCSIRCKRED